MQKSCILDVQPVDKQFLTDSTTACINSVRSATEYDFYTLLTTADY